MRVDISLPLNMLMIHAYSISARARCPAMWLHFVYHNGSTCRIKLTPRLDQIATNFANDNFECIVLWLGAE